MNAIRLVATAIGASLGAIIVFGLVMMVVGLVWIWWSDAALKDEEK